MKKIIVLIMFLSLSACASSGYNAPYTRITDSKGKVTNYVSDTRIMNTQGKTVGYIRK